MLTHSFFLSLYGQHIFSLFDSLYCNLHLIILLFLQSLNIYNLTRMFNLFIFSVIMKVCIVSCAIQLLELGSSFFGSFFFTFHLRNIGQPSFSGTPNSPTGDRVRSSQRALMFHLVKKLFSLLSVALSSVSAACLQIH